MNFDDETGFPFEHFAYWNRWLPRSKSLMNPFWLLSSSTHDRALFLPGFVKIGYNFYGTHANSNSQTCTHTQVEIRTPQNIHFCKLVVYHSHHSWVGDSLLWKNLVTVLESLVMDVIISRGLFPLFTVFSNFDVWHFCNNHAREVWWLPILGK